MVSRVEAKNIYAGLTNEEKKKWAEEAGYTSYHGLYRNLSSTAHAEGIVYFKIMEALIRTVGVERYNQYIEEIQNNIDIKEIENKLKINSVEEFNKAISAEVLSNICNYNDLDGLDTLKKNLEAALNITNNQINNLKILDAY